MKTYINEQKKECVVTLTDLKVIDEWTKVVDLKPLKKVLEALETLERMWRESTFSMCILI